MVIWRTVRSWLISRGHAALIVSIAVGVIATTIGVAMSRHDGPPREAAGEVDLVDSPTPLPSESPMITPSETPSASVTSRGVAAPSATLSLVGSATSGKQATLRLRVTTPDTWTAFMLSFNTATKAKDFAESGFSRVFHAGGLTYADGEIDESEVFNICNEKTPDLTSATDRTRDFTFTPIQPKSFRAVVAVLRGRCPSSEETQSNGWADMHLIGKGVVTGELRFDVADGHFKYEKNGLEEPGINIGFTKYYYDPYGPAYGDNPQPGFEFSVADADGWVTSVTIDWGDGSPAEQAHELTAATNHGGAYCVGYIASRWVTQPEHTYSVPGTYTITVTAITGGGSANEQTVTSSKAYTATVASPQPSPSPST